MDFLTPRFNPSLFSHELFNLKDQSQHKLQEIDTKNSGHSRDSNVTVIYTLQSPMTMMGRSTKQSYLKSHFLALLFMQLRAHSRSNQIKMWHFDEILDFFWKF
jgi:hypothetical protein